MKIAQVVCSYPPYAGGIGNSAKQIKKLLEDRYEIQNYTPGEGNPLIRYGQAAFWPQLAWCLKNFDYIYLHYPFFGSAEAIWLYKALGGKAKLIIHYHMDVKSSSWLKEILSWPSRLIFPSLLKQADKIVVSSYDYARKSALAKYYQTRPDKFREIPFSINTDKFCPKEADKNTLAAKIVDFVKEKFIKKDRLDLLFVGGLDRAHYFKGVNILLESLNLIKEKNWRLEIVGDGDLRPEYERQSAAYGLEKKIIFRGRLDENGLIRAYQEADFLVLPSINSNEAFGIVVIESLACGTPAIVSDLPGVRQVFQEGKHGYLIKAGEAASLKSLLEKIIAGSDWQKMRPDCRHLAEERYSEKVIRKKLESLFS